MCYFIDEGRLYTFTVYQQPELLIEATAKAAGTSVRARQNGPPFITVYSSCLPGGHSYLAKLGRKPVRTSPLAF
jgi:hypothetical protein